MTNRTEWRILRHHAGTVRRCCILKRRRQQRACRFDMNKTRGIYVNAGVKVYVRTCLKLRMGSRKVCVVRRTETNIIKPLELD